MGVLSNNKDVTAVQARCLGAVSEFSVLRRGGREGESVVAFNPPYHIIVQSAYLQTFNDNNNKKEELCFDS